jgi:hypothetical protein
MLDQNRTMLPQNVTANHMALQLSLFDQHLIDPILETPKASKMGRHRSKIEGSRT